MLEWEPLGQSKLKQMKWKLPYFYSGISHEAWLQSLTFLPSERSLAEAVKLLIPTGALYNFCKWWAGSEALTFSPISTSQALCGFGIAAAAGTFLPCILPNHKKSHGSPVL